MDTINRLSPITIALHWLVALSIMGLLCLGLYMTEFEQWGLYHIHKSLGILLAFVVLIRVLWRIKSGWLVPAQKYSKWEVSLAKSIHWGLIVSTVLMPVSGMLYSGASGHGFGVFGFEILHSNHSPDNPSLVIPLSEFWSDVGQRVHGLNGYVLVAAIFIHAAGAIKHHFIDRDSTLSRMFGKVVG